MMDHSFQAQVEFTQGEIEGFLSHHWMETPQSTKSQETQLEMFRLLKCLHNQSLDKTRAHM